MSAYLDHAATTPMLPVAVEAMLPYLSGHHENPSSIHAGGRAARRALDDARDALAALLGCEPGDLVFTSGGTEADNLAILGVAGGTSDRVVVSAIEHHAVLEPARLLEARIAPVGHDGCLDLAAFAALLDPSLLLVSVMAVNNETGMIQPIADVAALVRELAPNAVLHCDAVQAVPWCDVAAATAEFDLVSCSAHKFGGPKGVGALVVRSGVRARVRPRQLGGAQESELRAGTENVAGIVAAGAAATAWAAGRSEIVARVGALRDRLEDGLVAGGAQTNAPRSGRVCSIAPLRFADVSTEELLIALDRRGIAASSGAACASGALEPSHVLLAAGRSTAEIEGSIRISLGWSSSQEDIDEALEVLPATVGALVSSTGAR